MPPKQISPLLQTWYKWKALRLPWRKRFLVGLDLQGNTYWEFRDVRGDPADPRTRWRRIVQYPRRDTHYGEVKVPPQWHQWLRHTRDAPPSIPEQHAEVRRQQQMRVLAAEADARWAAKPTLLDAGGQPAAPALGGGGSSSMSMVGEGGSLEEGGAAVPGEDAGKKEDPWGQSRRGGPSEDWQPQAWSPPAPKR
ncbi:hypothetical protein KVR01_008756 [Diaporthe batatas]|uniref:uncharacterized protein n=1 Tax=Diaporthe batatas TaxID=748121 RepID=UPI001D0457B4|nr:uncharacterized protein KVR01_008756 [Diaporthe batatas]KAG8161769.1 hypothetical protein KVR01_008756 [Diaporthe batatas]